MPADGPTAVVVPLDGTEPSRSVLPLAYLLAGTFERPLHRVHVAGRVERGHDHARRAHDEALSLLRHRHPRPPDDGEGGRTVVATPEVVVDLTDGDAAGGARDLAVVHSADPDVEVVLPGDDPAATLIDYLAGRSDAVVCMASRARGGLHRRLVGNTTEQVVRTSTCPVVAIGPNADRGAIGRPPATLLLAVGSGLPAGTLEVVAGWARAFGAEVVAAHVDPPVRAGARNQHGQGEVVALSNRLQGLGVEARGRIVAGPRIADALLTVAASLPQPLLLVAPVGERDNARVPTDVTHQLLHAGRWPVLATVGRP
jgi:nucleotide-binding universal stress UspA family protein